MKPETCKQRCTHAPPPPGSAHWEEMSQQQFNVFHIWRLRINRELNKNQMKGWKWGEAYLLHRLAPPPPLQYTHQINLQADSQAALINAENERWDLLHWSELHLQLLSYCFINFYVFHEHRSRERIQQVPPTPEPAHACIQTLHTKRWINNQENKEQRKLVLISFSDSAAACRHLQCFLVVSVRHFIFNIHASESSAALHMNVNEIKRQ